MPVAQRRELILERLHRPGGARRADLAGNLPVPGPSGRGNPPVPEVRGEPRRARDVRERADSTAPDLIAPLSRRDTLVTDFAIEQKVPETPTAHAGRPTSAHVGKGRG